MSNLQEFHKPAKAYKQVKAEKVRLPDKHGANVTHSVMVYMSTAGTPHFGIGIPEDYRNAWERHQDENTRKFHASLYINKDGSITSATYEGVLKDLEVIAHNFQRHIRNVNMRKVIRVALEIKGATGYKKHCEPNFSKSRVLVGIRSGIFWEVNGGYYAWDGARRDGQLAHLVDCADEDHESPSYSDLHPQDMAGDPITIPYTPEAWATVQEVESMLVRAADMLLKLTDTESAQVLLAGGFQALTAIAAPVHKHEDASQET